MLPFQTYVQLQEQKIMPKSSRTEVICLNPLPQGPPVLEVIDAAVREMHRDRERSEGDVGRRGRGASTPDRRLVETRRELERSEGGPRAPHNSMETSVVILEEDSEEFQPVFADAFTNAASALDETIDLTDSPVAAPRPLEETSSPESASTASSVSIKCPICYDSASTITAEGGSLVSTVCGHIFCSPCLTASLRSRPFCPSCRKLCTSRDFHPIFLG